ncbi:NAD(P)-binding protein [Melanomma pulvis-pyrius CBS 109.77]|uniref:NAD(P)-binding protein n=1 Tax=Melanomma pulvis-pyrius CBS 109.77 TaxID=1314802 RepID=A0A6A6XJG2_9PLEO|nr:NAD(P)-binding protein [Melanomma pulvis-pyrius CBS 109.77]
MALVHPGGLILITGANGYIAGVTIQKFLDAGFRVRGTVRNVSKNGWMTSQYGPNFSLIEVPDMAAENAFVEAVKGVDGIAHIASSMSFSLNPQDVIPPVIKGSIGLLEAAAKEKSVKSFVYTSSQGACITMEPHKVYHIDENTWNEESKRAWELPFEGGFERMALNYLCSKTEGEQHSFRWVEENKPHFTFNSVVPNYNFGTLIAPEHTGFGSSAAMLKMLWEGDMTSLQMLPPAWYVDTEDTALLHVAALTLPDVNNERIFAFGERFCWNQILSIFKKEVPDKEFVDKVEEVEDCGTVANGRAEELLKRLGKKRFSTLDEGIKKFIPWMLREEKKKLDAGDM